MKCPLLTIGIVNPSGLRKGKWNDCLKGECAWWDSGPDCCILKSATYILLALSQEMAEIKEKIPHAGQFTK